MQEDLAKELFKLDGYLQDVNEIVPPGPISFELLSGDFRPSRR
jgi:hypothetical protein